MTSTLKPKQLRPSEARHVVGIDLGTTNVRVHVTHYLGARSGNSEPSLVHLPGSERDGALPSVLELSEGGKLRSFGVPALMNMTRTENRRYVLEFKPCIGQSPSDLSAQGRPERARFCANKDCLHPGWAWSPAIRFCGFCGGPLEAASAIGDRWQPSFRYSQAEALTFTELLLLQIGRRLEAQFGEALDARSGWLVSVGVPVHWQDETRSAYEDKVRQAFPQAAVNLVYEPTGALRYYSMRNLLKPLDRSSSRLGWTLVVDFGGGTTDLVLAKVEQTEQNPRIVEVRSYGERYGGADFDLILAHYAAGELEVPLDGGLLTQWKIQAKEWKEAFSARVHQDMLLRSMMGSTQAAAAFSDEDSEVTVTFPVPKAGGLFEYAPVTLQRTAFARAAGDLVERFRSVLDRGLRHFGVAPDEVEQVILTGGGAHWYFVQETVAQFLPDARLLSGIEPEMSISKGLALAIDDAPPPRTFRGRQPAAETYDRSVPFQGKDENGYAARESIAGTRPLESAVGDHWDFSATANVEAASTPVPNASSGEPATTPDETVIIDHSPIFEAPVAPISSSIIDQPAVPQHVDLLVPAVGEEESQAATPFLIRDGRLAEGHSAVPLIGVEPSRGAPATIEDISPSGTEATETLDVSTTPAETVVTYHAPIDETPLGEVRPYTPWSWETAHSTPAVENQPEVAPEIAAPAAIDSPAGDSMFIEPVPMDTASSTDVRQYTPWSWETAATAPSVDALAEATPETVGDLPGPADDSMFIEPVPIESAPEEQAREYTPWSWESAPSLPDAPKIEPIVQPMPIQIDTIPVGQKAARVSPEPTPLLVACAVVVLTVLAVLLLLQSHHTPPANGGLQQIEPVVTIPTDTGGSVPATVGSTGTLHLQMQHCTAYVFSDAKHTALVAKASRADATLSVGDYSVEFCDENNDNDPIAVHDIHITAGEICDVQVTKNEMSAYNLCIQANKATPAQSVVYLRNALALNPHSVDANLGLAYYYNATGHASQALPYAQAANRTVPEDKVVSKVLKALRSGSNQ